MIALVLNVGSTTLKFACIDIETDNRLTEGIIDRIGQDGGDAEDHLSAARDVLDQHANIGVDVIGHRIVQGGSIFQSPTFVTADVLEKLKTLDHFAPLHNPPARSVVEAITQSNSSLKQVLVFDTAYFSTLPSEAYRYAIPKDIYNRFGVRRYGAHGTSHRFVTEKALAYLADHAPELHHGGRIISLHLGGGASATASRDGVAVETSMGMTPLEGLVMATRCGDIDPSVPLYLVQHAGMTTDEVGRLMNQSSGLLGLCGESDMRSILSRRENDDEDATLAINIYIHRLVKTVGAYAAVLGGIDAIIFTAGVGENAFQIRSLVIKRLRYLGLELNEDLNGKTIKPSQIIDISSDSATAKTLVVPTDEEIAIASQAVQTVS